MGSVEEGTIEGLALPRLFGRLVQEGATGVLEVTHDGGISRAFFREGTPAGALVFSNFKPLGVYLLDRGIIDVEALDRSLAEVAKGGRRQGEVLVDLGYLTEEALLTHLEAQQQEHLVELLMLEEGHYRFDPEAALPEWTAPLAVDPAAVVRAWAEARQEAGGTQDLSELGADPVRALLGEAGGGPGGGTAPSSTVDSGGGSEAPAAPEPAQEASATRAPAGGSTAPGSSAAGAKTPDAKGPRKPARTRDVKARRAKLLKRAFQNIPGAEVLNRKPDGERPLHAGPQSSQGKEKPATPQPSRAVLGAEAVRLQRDVEAKAKAVAKQNYYERLEIEPDAPAERIKAAYFVLVKKYHPDRAGPLGLDAACRKKMNDIFSAVQEAYETLSKPEAKAEYDRMLADERVKGDRAKARRVAKGELAKKKGIALAKKKDWAGAIEELEEAQKILGESGEIAIHLAWALWNLGPRKEVEGRVRTLLKKAVAPGEPDPIRARGYYYQGLLARIDQKWEEAEKLLSRAVKLDDKLTEAVTELRVLRRRLERQEVTGKRFLRKLFGK